MFVKTQTDTAGLAGRLTTNTIGAGGAGTTSNTSAVAAIHLPALSITASVQAEPLPAVP